MANLRLRTLLLTGLALIGVWFVATGGYIWSRQSKMTAEKVRQYLSSVDFGSLQGENRVAAIEDLARRINGLSIEERRMMRLNREWETWFVQMTEEEKATFVEATMPTGIKQMMAAFEEQPEAERRKTIDIAMKRLRESREMPPTDDPFRRISDTYTNPPPPISPELERRMRVIGLKAFYTESSAQTKAEAAPLIEEIQRLMESGGGRR